MVLSKEFNDALMEAAGVLDEKTQDIIDTGDACVNWIKNYFTDNGDKDTVAVIGMSGGKDSLIAAALCVKALGPKRVVGVMMPNGEQKDINDAIAAIDYLGIQSVTMNIEDAVEGVYSQLAGWFGISDTIKTNTPPRIRMTVLYAIANAVGGRVVNTSNASERFVGWSTKWGDGVGDLFPLVNLTVTELLELGVHYLDLPRDLLFKAPDDGMTGKSDEENLGFTYEVLDKYIRGDEIPDVDTLQKIKDRHKASRHKIVSGPSFVPCRGKFSRMGWF